MIKCHKKCKIKSINIIRKIITSINIKFWTLVLPISILLFWTCISPFYSDEYINMRGKGGSFLKLLYEIGGIPLVATFTWCFITGFQYLFHYMDD